MTKPPHLETIEANVEDLQRGALEEQYARWLREWRNQTMTTGQWEKHLQDEDFLTWVGQL